MNENIIIFYSFDATRAIRSERKMNLLLQVSDSDYYFYWWCRFRSYQFPSQFFYARVILSNEMILFWRRSRIINDFYSSNVETLKIDKLNVRMESLRS